MELREMRRIADHETRQYRTYKAYLKGYEDGGGDGTLALYVQRARWVWAVERVLEQIAAQDGTKAVFFRRYYGLDRPTRRRSDADCMLRLGMELCVSEAGLYKWRDEILTMLAVAGAQVKAFRPYEVQ